MTDKLLIVEDDPETQRQLRWVFADRRCLFAKDEEGALGALRAQAIEVVLLDLGLPPEPDGPAAGFRALEAILNLRPETKVVVVTGQDRHAHAIRAIGAGAHDFVAKPIARELLRFVVERAFRLAALEAENRRLSRAAEADLLPGLVGSSPAMREVAALAERLAPVDANLLLLGETGSGRTSLARAIHALSGDDRPCLVLSGAALPAPALEAELFGAGSAVARLDAAGGGALILDDVDDVPPELQVRLVGLLQDPRLGPDPATARARIRLIATARPEATAALAEGRFRRDLHDRLAEVVVKVPPLRARAGDPVLLAKHFLHRYGQSYRRSFTGFAPEALAAVEGHGWPGNVRELSNRVKRAVIMAERKRISAEDLDLGRAVPEEDRLALRRIREAAEGEALHKALALTDGNISKASRLLGVSRPTLYEMIKQHGVRLDPPAVAS